MRRRVAGLLVAALLSGVAALFVAPATAAAFFNFCEADAPPPTPPKAGFAGGLTAKPATPADGDPFTNPDIALHHVYGLSWNWSVYDLGCASAITDTGVPINNDLGSLMLSFAAGFVAVLDVLERAAVGDGAGWFSEWVGRSVEAMRPVVYGGPGFAGLLVLGVMVAAIVIIYAARKADVSDVLKRTGVVLACVALAGLVFAVPGSLSRGMDEVATTTAKVSGSAVNSSLTDAVNRHALYRAWLSGQFGDADSDVAKRYGPRVLAATHYTWAEWDRAQSDQGYREQLDERKADEYKQIAEEIEDNHPSVYPYFQGRGGLGRAGAAAYAAIPLAAMGFFVFLWAGTVLFARLVLQLLVIAAAVAAVAGLLPRGTWTLKAMADIFFAALWAIIKFSLAAGVMVFLLGALAGLDPASAWLWMAIFTVGALYLLKPFRTFKTVMPGLDPNRKYMKELFGAAVKAGASAAGAGVGGVVGATMGAQAAGRRVNVGDLTVPQDAAPRRARAELSVRPDLPPRTALPPPHMVQVGPAARNPRAALAGPAAGPPARAGLPAGPVPTGGGGLALAGPGRRELEGPVKVEVTRKEGKGSVQPVRVVSGEVMAPEPVAARARPAPGGVVTIPGQVVPTEGLYQRPTETPATAPKSVSRSVDLEPPGAEVVLYRSAKQQRHEEALV